MTRSESEQPGKHRRPSSLPERFRAALHELLAEVHPGPGTPGQVPLIAAVSGGRDSVVMLHLLRFETGLDPRTIVVAHFDHQMRGESAADAEWVAELAVRWGMPFRLGVAETPIHGEAEARAQRYSFLQAVMHSECASFSAGESSGDLQSEALPLPAWPGAILTAHHADDQAETVLFRVARGTGVDGLVGIQRHRDDGVIRPLLDSWGQEIAEYAEIQEIEWRTDPTNASHGPARNILRHRILPELEARVAPGVRRALVRLADNALADRRAWTAVLEPHLREVVVAETDGRIDLDRGTLTRYLPELRQVILRTSARRVGLHLNHASTALLSTFCEGAQSGSTMALRGGRAVREFGRVCILRAGRVPSLASGHEGPARKSGPDGGTDDSVADADSRLVIEGTTSGQCHVRIGDTTYRASWSSHEGGEVRSQMTDPLGGSFLKQRQFDAVGLVFPLELRAWIPGDRIRVDVGTKKVKKIFNEARIGVTARGSVPLLVNGDGRVLWIPGVARSIDALPRKGTELFEVMVERT